MLNLCQKLKQHWIRIAALLIVYDVLAINVSYGMALWLRFDCRFSMIPELYFTPFLQYIPIHTVCTILIFVLLNLYKSIWRFASFNEFERIFVATLLSCGLHAIGITILFQRMPMSYYFIGTMLQFVATMIARFSYRFVHVVKERNGTTDRKNIKNVMVIGAGEGGQMLINELSGSAHVNAAVKCVIDDNPNKIGRYISGVPIVGGRDDILANVKKHKIDQIFFAIPTATPEEKRDILNICKESGCALKSLPGLYQLINGEVTVSQLHDVSVEELLGRDPIKVDLDQILGYVSGKTVLVTGAGGSIGSELCRQLASHNPKQLILFDVYENTTYDIEQELLMNHPDINLLTLIGSVCDVGCIEQVFEKYHPDIVYHAAAHKHVPLMETSPNEAVKNNVFGTLNTALAAGKYGVKRFVLISTDKAVNPTNIMGATKRLCEMIIQTLDKKFNTEFVAVRFGNVLGSNGSVIPLFQKQIARGGPVTVTHPDIIRYFMTIPEAVSLVLQAGAYAKGGEIFVLDMGVPVKIDDLARNLIKLSGYTPDVDIKIVYTGLRPGEKLFEEKLMAEEGMKKTDNQLIHIGQPIEMDGEQFMQDLEKLRTVAFSNSEETKQVVAKIVPTYTVQ